MDMTLSEEAAEPLVHSPAEEQGERDDILRKAPDGPAARLALVSRWHDTIRRDKKHWAPVFKQMRADAKFARLGADQTWVDDEKYVTNLVLRHVGVKTAALYAKNPTVQAKRRERLMSSAWDGTVQQIQAAASDPMDPMNRAILMDAQRIATRGQMLDALASTMKLVLTHQISQVRPPFKRMMKRLVRRAISQKVGYVKLGFVREGTMQLDPGALERNADFASVHATIDRLTAEATAKKINMNDADSELLRLTMAGAQSQEFIVTHEGLSFDFPHSTAIIPDRRMTSLDGFQGCDHVTEEFLLTPEKVKEFFGVDPCGMSSATRYRGTGEEAVISSNADDNDRYCVWQTYCKTDGLVYWTLDGWSDFLKEPAPPPIRLERFWPWFPLAFNEVEDDEQPYPPSDVELLRHVQREYNRSRDGIRQHRIANRPGLVANDAVMTAEDVEAITNRGDFSVTLLKSLQPGTKLEDALQAIKGAGIDPNLYDTSFLMDDFLRASGSQEANIGGGGGSTATEASIAENSRMSSMESSKDDLDMLLAEMFGEAGQIVLREMSKESVARIAGEGAVWPEIARDDITDEIFVTIQAGSSGKPNKQVELQNIERLVPILIQTPGIKPEWLARQVLHRMDEDIDLSEAVAEGLPSIQTMNAMAKAGGPPGMGGGMEMVGDGKNPPGAQGHNGGDNAERVPQAGGRIPIRRPGVGSGAQPMNGAPGGM